MAIKNWTVIVESVKSTAARELYLNNINHSNHSHTERIVSIWGSPETTLNIQHQCDKRRLAQALKRKGGRPPTPALEYVFTLSKGIRPSDHQWRAMLKSIINTLSRSMGVKPSDFNNVVRAVLHQQKQEQTRGTGDHLHVLIGKFNDGKYFDKLQKKGGIHAAKLGFNAAVMAELGISHNHYIAEKNYSKPAKKRAPQWKVRAAREKEAQEQSLVSIEHNLSKVFKQCEKWLQAFEHCDKRQMNRQYNRIIKSLDLLAHEEIRNDKLTRLIDSMTTTIDAKSKKFQSLPKLVRKF